MNDKDTHLLAEAYDQVAETRQSKEDMSTHDDNGQIHLKALRDKIEDLEYKPFDYEKGSKERKKIEGKANAR